jgi:O-antigen ligase
MYPHNFILELLAEYGVVGLLLFLSAPLYLFRTLARHGASSIKKNPAFYFIIYYSCAMMFSGALQSIWPFFFFVGWFWAAGRSEFNLVAPKRFGRPAII